MFAAFLALVLASSPASDPLCHGGARFSAPGFAEESRDEANVWLVDEARGLELRVLASEVAAGSRFEDEVALWLGDFVEEAGFRRALSEEREVGGARAAIRVWTGSGKAGTWRTQAALVVTGGRAWAITLLVPPGRRAEGDAAFEALLSSFRPGGC